MAEGLPKPLYKSLKQHFTSDNSADEAGGQLRKYPHDALATVEAVEDGDTWKGKRKPDPEMEIGPGYYRLVGIDTHETDGKNSEKGKKEKEFTKQWVEQGRKDWSEDEWPFIVVFSDPQHEFEGAYGRALVNLVRRSDGADLKQSLLSWAEKQDDIKPKNIKYKP